jgi:hypothetical protein
MEALMEGLRRLSRPAMLALAEALENGRVELSSNVQQIGEVVPDDEAAAVSHDLRALGDAGAPAVVVSGFLRSLAAERAVAQALADRYELVWSGDEISAETRSTSVVVRQLFQAARRSVLVASYAFDYGEGAAALFGGLAARMDGEPDLIVRVFVNVDRKYGDERSDAELLRDYADRGCPRSSTTLAHWSLAQSGHASTRSAS